MQQPPVKQPIHISAEEYKLLDEFHQCAAIVLQRDGRAIIEGNPVIA